MEDTNLGHALSRSRSLRSGLLKKSIIKVLMLLVSILAGAVGVQQSKKHIDSQIQKLSDKPEPIENMRQVVVPTRALSQGEIVQAHDLSLREIPERYTDSNSVTADHYQLAVGQRIDFDVDEGRALLWAHLAGGVSPTFSGSVREGLRALTVRVDDVNSLSGFLQPGDKVDLLLSHGLGAELSVVPIIQRLEVIATGNQTHVDKTGNSLPRNFSTITVHVRPDDAQKLTLAQQVGKLTAVLRNPRDSEPVTHNAISLSQLIGKEGDAAAKPIRSTKALSSKHVVVRKVPAIEYIIGGS